MNNREATAWLSSVLGGLGYKAKVLECDRVERSWDGWDEKSRREKVYTDEEAAQRALLRECAEFVDAVAESGAITGASYAGAR